MKIPIFLSSPSTKNLNARQKKVRSLIEDELEQLNLDPRSLGSSDYPKECPLKEVLVIASHCCGGLILGFEQFRATRGFRAKAPSIQRLPKPLAFPTAWNNLEAGILFGLQLPLLIFKEEYIEGGVFDYGVTDLFVHQMPKSTAPAEQEALKHVLLSWQTNVRAKYYELNLRL